MQKMQEKSPKVSGSIMKKQEAAPICLIGAASFYLRINMELPKGFNPFGGLEDTSYSADSVSVLLTNIS